MKQPFGIILFLALCVSLYAQTPSAQKSPPLDYASPKSVGMSAERLHRIDAMAESAIADGDVPGIVALVARKGKIVYHKAFGLADAEAGRELKRDDIFRIFSQTKAITGTAVMMLWEEGLFRLDDPISKWIPEFKNPQVLDTYNYTAGTYTTRPAKSEITIRHLLTHSSGIGYGGIDRDERMRLIYKEAGIIEAVTQNNVLISDNIKKLAKLPLHFDPGEKYYYSMGLDALGYFIEIVSGMPLDEFFHSRIFKPLGMEDTYFYLPAKKADRLVMVHGPSRDGKWIQYLGDGTIDPDYPIKGAQSLFSGGGGLLSTSTDYANFLQMYLNGGELNGIRLLSRTTIETMMASGVDMSPVSQYGLAFSVLNEEGVAAGGLGSEGTFRWGGAANTQYFADPDEQVIGVILKQTFGQRSDDTRWQFKQMVFQAIDD